MQKRLSEQFFQTLALFQAQYQASWLLRWSLIQLPAWGLAFGLALLPVSIFGGWGLLFPGLIIGLIVGGLQQMALRTQPDLAEDDLSDWILWSGAGGCFGTLFVYIAGIVLLLNFHLGLLLMGAIFGACLHGMQAYALRDVIADSLMVWLFAGLVGGGFCALLTGVTLTTGLPIFCSPGVLVFGIITGYALLLLLRDEKAS